MGTFSVPVEIGSPQREQWVELEALVDTGASITSVPASVLRSLGVTPVFRQTFPFGQGETRVMAVGQTWIRVQEQEREVITLVLFNDEGTTPLLGAMALEGIFIGVDPHAKRLIPVEGLMM